MQVYLPIAGMSVDPLIITALGAVVGFLSGMFGVGGGFLMTPFLIFLGVPPAVAVGTQASQLVAASVSGVLGHWRRGNVDVRLGLVMLSGGTLGSAAGVVLFGLFQRLGQIDLVIPLLYVVLLGVVGLLMLGESVLALVKRPRRDKHPRPARTWDRNLPFRMHFHHSRLKISALLPFGIGLVGGLLVALMGIGGGFIMVPAMIYILGMPVALVAGTSLFQIIFTTAAATLMQAAFNHTVDVMLALLLLAGGVVGAQFGTRAGAKLRGETARALLALLVVLVSVKLTVDLLSPPDDRYSIVIEAPR